MDLDIRFCTTADGASIAYATVGSGPPLVVPPGWVSHLEMNWEDPPTRAFFERLAQRHTVVRYDKLGCGLSDRDRTDFTIDSEVRALEAVVDKLALNQFPIFGMSQGGPTAVSYAVRHPKRVSQLIFYDTFADGPATASDDFKVSFVGLVRSHWGVGSKTLADLFLPGADAEAIERFAKHQRGMTTAAMAAELLNLTYTVDVTPLLSRLQQPVVIMHRRGDRAVPFRLGRQMAALIPNARFVPLEGNVHAPWSGDSEAVLRVIFQALGEEAEPAPAGEATAAEHRSEERPVFLSYAAEDRATANAIVAALEARGTACWIAPRDIRSGADYAEAIYRCDPHQPRNGARLLRTRQPLAARPPRGGARRQRRPSSYPGAD